MSALPLAAYRDSDKILKSLENSSMPIFKPTHWEYLFDGKEFRINLLNRSRRRYHITMIGDGYSYSWETKLPRANKYTIQRYYRQNRNLILMKLWERESPQL